MRQPRAARMKVNTFPPESKNSLLRGLTNKISTLLYIYIFIKIKKNSSLVSRYAEGLNHLPYLLSTSVSLAVIKDFSTNYMMALGFTEKRYGY